MLVVSQRPTTGGYRWSGDCAGGWLGRRVAQEVGLDGQESVPGESESGRGSSDDADAEMQDSTAD